MLTQKGNDITTAAGTMTLELQNTGGDRSQPFKAKRGD
jgi:hypothetical protein